MENARFFIIFIANRYQTGSGHGQIGSNQAFDIENGSSKGTPSSSAMSRRDSGTNSSLSSSLLSNSGMTTTIYMHIYIGRLYTSIYIYILCISEAQKKYIYIYIYIIEYIYIEYVMYYNIFIMCAVWDLLIYIYVIYIYIDVGSSICLRCP